MTGDDHPEGQDVGAGDKLSTNGPEPTTTEADLSEARPGTALATIPWPSSLSRGRRPATALASLVARGQAAAAELQFANQRPPSLRDQLAYAATGEWTEDAGGVRRHVMHAYVVAIAVPLTTAAYIAAWAAARPLRLATTTAVTTLVCTALNTIPGLRWLVPDWTTLPYWPPLSWIFLTEGT